jgi:hypothetical protein
MKTSLWDLTDESVVPDGYTCEVGFINEQDALKYGNELGVEYEWFVNRVDVNYLNENGLVVSIGKRFVMFVKES